MRLGILGGGQLALMTLRAASQLGIETVIFERYPNSPAARFTRYEIVGPWEDEARLNQFAAMVDVITLESEFVDVPILQTFERWGKPIYPTSSMIEVIQDKLIQKQTMQATALPVPVFAEAQTPQNILDFGKAYGYPLVLKARRNGYDGYGNVTLYGENDIAAGLSKLANRTLLVEGFVPFTQELAVMVVRNLAGDIRCYPVVETIQQNHICHVVKAPAAISADIAAKAQDIAIQAVNAIHGVGVFGVELFALEGDMLLNEIAPRPHNSGHYTIEGCVTSQFENHVRAVMGLPLGITTLSAPAVVMVNILGQRQGQATLDSVNRALAVEGAHVHIYSKAEVRIGRKMGHVTALGDTLAEAETIARYAADLIDL